MPDPYSMQNRAQMADMSPESLVFRGVSGAGPRMPMPSNSEVQLLVVSSYDKLSLITFLYLYLNNNNLLFY